MSVVVRLCFLTVAFAVFVNCEQVHDVDFDKATEFEITPKPGIVFSVPKDLCENDDEIHSVKCTEHCQYKGYGDGFCFDFKCTCN